MLWAQFLLADVNVGTMRLMKTLCRCPLVIQFLPNSCSYQIINSFSKVAPAGDSLQIPYTGSPLPWGMCLDSLPHSLLSSPALLSLASHNFSGISCCWQRVELSWEQGGGSRSALEITSHCFILNCYKYCSWLEFFLLFSSFFLLFLFFFPPLFSSFFFFFRSFFS